jgi:hypothetical protein
VTRESEEKIGNSRLEKGGGSEKRRKEMGENWCEEKVRCD